MRISLMDFVNLEKELKKSLKVGIILLKKKKKRSYTRAICISIVLFAVLYFHRNFVWRL